MGFQVALTINKEIFIHSREMFILTQRGESYPKMSQRHPPILLLESLPQLLEGPLTKQANFIHTLGQKRILIPKLEIS